MPLPIDNPPKVNAHNSAEAASPPRKIPAEVRCVATKLLMEVKRQGVYPGRPTNVSKSLSQSECEFVASPNKKSRTTTPATSPSRKTQGCLQFQTPPRHSNVGFETPAHTPTTRTGPGQTPLSALPENTKVAHLFSESHQKLSMHFDYTLEKDFPHPAPNVVSRYKSRGLNDQQIKEVLSKESLAPSDRVTYLTLAEAGTYVVKFEDGKATWQGSLLGSEQSIESQNNRIGCSLIGVSIKGNLYVSPEHVVGAGLSKSYVHHSTLLSGRDVDSAFKIVRVQEGVIRIISNDSGHYKPGAKELLHLCYLLEVEMRADDFNHLLVDYIDTSGKKTRMSVLKFLEDQELRSGSVDLNSLTPIDK